MPEEACKDHLVDVTRQRCRRRIGDNGVRADGDRRLDALAAALLHSAEILRAVLVDVPMHARRAAVILLQAVHADIALARCRILGKDERQGHKRTAVVRPAFQDGNLVEIRVLRLDDLLAGRILHVFREIDRLARHRNQGHEVHLILQGDVRNLEDLCELIGNIVELLHAERERHALVAAECIHQHGHFRALHILEEEGDILLPLQL